MIRQQGTWLLNIDVDHQSERPAMVRTILMSVLIGLLSLVAVTTGWTADDDGSRLTIVSPAQGAVIKGDSVEVRYKLSKGTEATHIHCYVDGEYQKGFKGMVKGLTRGSHEIKLVAASHDHDALGVEAVVTVEVE
ncbi:hypothetical protein [Candidatus Nitrospira nitrificans]|uniref:Uncharacterized protein n=1 Tax=Candidatus Nitrospira nitrificans TaxID=1742973 RepID=A0A0S4L7D2_9BACT|nr:hypothetical protein [Candidatus Nitrospira nitrificans]CUS32512.1 hypothetical protein COMA2_100159 [Candidatus Nitrospira nitrificans]